jgi:hypothetical protein
MSWQEINELLGLALLDQDFCNQLLTSPLKAVNSKGFDLTDHEKEELCKIEARDIYHFSQNVIQRLAPLSLDDQEGMEK